MRRLTFIAAGLAALLATSIAVAHGIDGGKSAKAVAATFTATGSSMSTRTCTTTDGKSITITNGRYTGTASGDPDLTGAITLSARSVINTTDNVGVVDGQFRIDVSGGHDTFANYSAVYAGGNIAGLASGVARNSDGRLIANLSAGFSASGGFTSGKLGGGTSGGNAVELGPAKCAPTTSPKPEKSAGARHDLRALGQLDHRRRTSVRDRPERLGGRQREVQDERPCRDPLLAAERGQHARPHQRPRPLTGTSSDGGVACAEGGAPHPAAPHRERATGSCASRSA